METKEKNTTAGNAKETNVDKRNMCQSQLNFLKISAVFPRINANCRRVCTRNNYLQRGKQPKIEHAPHVRAADEKSWNN